MLTEKTTTRPPPATAVYWLVARGENGRSETLTIGGDEETLPVFSFREEAEAFLSFGALGEGWGIRRATAGELASILMGPCVGVGSVALDPMPEHAFEGMLRLVSLGRERFLSRLVEEVRLENAETRLSGNPNQQTSPSRCVREPMIEGFPPRESHTGVRSKGTPRS